MESSSILVEHAADFISALAWVVVGVTSAFMALAIWSINQVLRRLGGIEHELKTTNVTLHLIERDVRREIDAVKSDISSVSSRVSVVESSCAIYHGKDRRDNNRVDLEGTISE